MDQLYCGPCKRYLTDRFVEGVCPSCGSDEARGDQCDACQKTFNATELKNPRCKLCSTRPEHRTSEHIFLDVPKIEPRLRSWVTASKVKGAWTENTIAMTEGAIAAGLKKRCITRDLKWGTPVPLDGFRDKVFYVWFDAPIGYISITAGYTPDGWRSWWQNPDHVELVQFMGKDNVPFHTVMFPSSLIGTGDPWTLVHHVSTTEYLNYETGKFSKSRKTGVFGDTARDCGFPADTFRYVLLANRPESMDSVFSWMDFEHRVNGELLANLGNLINRTLKFVKDRLGGVIPALPGAGPESLTAADREFVAAVDAQIVAYRRAMDKVRLREGLKCFMDLSMAANKYSQDMKAWDLLKTDPARCSVVMALLCRAIMVLTAVFEPFLPHMAAAVYKQLRVDPEPIGAGFDPYATLASLPAGHTLGDVEGLVPQIRHEKIVELQERFAGPRLPEFPLELRVGVVLEVKQHETAKLFIIQLQVGPDATATRQIVSGLTDHYAPADLLGKRLVFIANLKERNFQGFKSQGMILTGVSAATGRVSVLTCLAAEPGTQVVPRDTQFKPKPKLELKHFQELTCLIDAKGKAVYIPGPAGSTQEPTRHIFATIKGEEDIFCENVEEGSLIK